MERGCEKLPQVNLRVVVVVATSSSAHRYHHRHHRMGDMIARDRIPSSVLKRSLDAEHLFPGVSSPELELSAHLVARSISSDRPLLQVSGWVCGWIG